MSSAARSASSVHVLPHMVRLADRNSSPCKIRADHFSNHRSGPSEMPCTSKYLKGKPLGAPRKCRFIASRTLR